MNEIRKARKEDIPAIVKLLEEVLAVHHKIRPDIFSDFGSKYTYSTLEKMIDYGELIYVYVIDNKVVGHIFADPLEIRGNHQIYRHELYIDDLCVLKEYQGLGIGRKLYEFMKQYAKEHNFAYITLKVWEGNSAIKFYEKLGLTPRLYSLEEKL